MGMHAAALVADQAAGGGDGGRGLRISGDIDWWPLSWWRWHDEGNGMVGLARGGFGRHYRHYYTPPLFTRFLRPIADNFGTVWSHGLGGGGVFHH